MATKTQVVDGTSGVSGTIAVRNQDDYPVGPNAPIDAIDASAGGYICAIQDFGPDVWGGPDPQPPDLLEGDLLFLVYIHTGGEELVEAHEWVRFERGVTASPWDIERAFTITVTGKRIWRTETTDESAGRDNSPVYAKEVTETDEWVTEYPLTIIATFGSLSATTVVATEPAPEDVVFSPISLFALTVGTIHGQNWTKYADARDLAWDGETINLARYHKEHVAGVNPTTGGTGHYLDGLTGGFDFFSNSNAAWSAGPTIPEPFIVDFGSFGVWDRDGVLIGGARISGGFTASNHVPDSLNWSTENGAAVLGGAVYPTVTELRAVGTWVQSAFYIGLDFRNPDDSYDLHVGASWSFSITQTSAREQLLDDADLWIVLRVPPVNASTCYADTDWLGVYIMRRDDVGIYGPADALAHDDWIGSGGVPTADGAGAFTVTGDGSLTLTIPSGYQDRLDEVPLLTAPAGPPTIYLFHKSDVWAGEPAEGAYDWRGFEQLNIPITAPGGDPSALTLTLNYRTYVHHDNHVTDSTRSTDYSYTVTEHTQAFTLSPVGGAQTIEVPIIAVDEYPVYERVVSMVLTGFDDGAWVIGEPALPKAAVTQSILKTFEYDYQRGGASGHFDAAYVWYDADEPGGKPNRAELTVRNFDYRISAGEAALDLTVAYTLEQFASLIEKVSEVFECHRNDTAYFAAVRDDEDPPNLLTTAWAFNVCYPNAHDPDENPLEQDIS